MTSGGPHEQALGLNERGVHLAQAGDLAAAEPLFRRASQLYGEAGSRTHPEHLAALTNLAYVAAKLERPELLRTVCLEMAEIERLRWPAADPQLADALNDIASRAYDGHDDELADALLREALQIRRSAFGEQHPDVATALNNLANLRWRAGDLEETRRLMEHAFAIRSAVLPGTHPHIANSLSSLGRLALHENDPDEAERLFARTVEVLTARVGSDDPDVADAYEDLSRARRDRGDTPGSLLALGLAAKIRSSDDGAGEEHSRALNNLADLHYDVGDWDIACDLYAQSVDELRQAVGPYHPLVADVVTNLANAERARGEWDAAGRLYQQALEIARRHGADDEPRVRRVLADIVELRERKAELEPGDLLTQATTYHQEADYATAERLARRAVEIMTDESGDDHRQLGDALLVLGNSLTSLGDLDGGRDAYERGIEIVRADPAAGYATLAALLAGLGNVLHATGNSFAAEEPHRESLRILDANGGPRNATYSAGLRNLAVDLVGRGELEEAQDLLERAVALAEAQPQTGALGQALGSLGRLRLRHGDASGATTALERALELERAQSGTRHPDYAHALLGLVQASEAQGQIARAEACCREAVDVLLAALGQRHPTTLDAQRALADVLILIGDDDAAETLLQAVAAAQQQSLGDHHPSLAATLLALGNLYANSNRRAEAVPPVTKAAEIFTATLPPHHPSVVAALTSVGALYASIGAREAALDFLGRALRGAEHMSEHAPWAIPQIRAQLARIRRAEGDLVGAEELFEQALAALDDQSGRTIMAGVLHELAELRASRGDTAAAVDALERAFELTGRALADILGVASERTRLAFVAKQQHGLAVLLSIVCNDPSPSVVSRAFEIVIGQKALAAEVAANQRDELLSGGRPELADILRELARVRGQLARLLLAEPALPSNRGSHADDVPALMERRERLERTLARRVPEREAAQRLHVADSASIAAALPAGSKLVEIVQFDVGGGRAQDVVSMISGRGGPPTARYAAFVLSCDHGDRVQLVDLGDAHAIDLLVGRLRAWITGDHSERARGDQADARPTAASGTNLRAAVFTPIERILGDAHRVFIAPDGDLTRLPFEALPDGKGHLIDRYAITYLSAARDMLRFGVESGRSPGPSVVVADPDFDLRGPAPTERADRSGGARFARLTGTRKEGTAVAALLDGADTLFGFRAVESAIKALQAPRVLHLATHGFFLANPVRQVAPIEGDEIVVDALHTVDIPGHGTFVTDITPLYDEPEEQTHLRLRRLGAGQANPLLRSGLALAGVNTWLDDGSMLPDAEDGVLTAEDVAALDLVGTELVVLSACETGLGEVMRGEGVFGLRRAFVLAGAATLVMSLWKVADDETAELMTDFYRRMKDGAGRGDALRQAQLSMKARPGLSHPCFWAAFICQGDPGPLL